MSPLRAVGLSTRIAAALARRPWLWATALEQLRRFAPDSWWRRPPFLPLPAPGLWRFRVEAMYGDAGRTPECRDVITWLEWCRRGRRG